VKVLLLSLAILAPVLPLQAEVSFFHYLVETAKQGEAESEFILGMTYCDGWEGVIRTGTVAARWCELAAELGDQRPVFVFNLLQRSPDRIKPDRAEAIKWLTAAADRGDNYARVILGEMLLEGDGVPADWRHGAEWIHKSAAAGFAPAQFRLGVIYLVGDAATPKNPVEALAWFIVAAEAGSKPAVDFRDEQTAKLGRELARLAVLRSRELHRKS